MMYYHHVWNILASHKKTHQQKCSPRCTWSCWRRGRADWGSSAGAKPRWAPRSVSSWQRSAGGGPWESFDEGGPVGNCYISDCSKPSVLRMQVQYFEGEGPIKLIPIRAASLILAKKYFKAGLANSTMDWPLLLFDWHSIQIMPKPYQMQKDFGTKM